MKIDIDQCETHRRPLIALKTKYDLTECEKHYSTTFPGRPKQSSAVCPCCLYPCQKQPLRFLFSSSDLSYLGSGLPLYFSFILLCILLCLISTLVVSIPSLFFNLTSNSCEIQTNTLHCSNTMFLRMSVANKIGQDRLLQLQSYLVNGNILLVLVALQIARKKMRDLQVEVDLQPEASDYAVLIRLDQEEKYYRERDVKAAIDEWFLKQNQKSKEVMLFKCKNEFPVEKIIISYNLTTFKAMQKQLQQLTNEIKFSVPSPGGQNMAKKISRIQTIKELISNKSFARNPKCIAIFRYPQQKRYILCQQSRWFGCCRQSLMINGKKARVGGVPMPGEIIWQNHHLKKEKKLWMRVTILILTCLAIVVGEAIVFSLLYVWFRYIRTNASADQYVSPLISLLISGVNAILYKVLSKMTEYEYRPTTLEEMVSIVRKVTFSVFLNSGVMLLFAYFVLDLSSIWIYNGFIDTISYSFLFSMVLPQLYKYCNLDMLKGYYLRYKLRKNSSLSLSQPQANKIFQRTYDKLHEQYSWTLHQLWWASLFSPLVPIAYPCILISLVFHYFVQKVNFLYLFRQPKPFGNYLNLSMLNMLEFSLLLMGIGNLILDLIINKLSNTLIPPVVLATDLVGIGIGLGVLLLPSEWVNKAASVLLCMEKEKMFLNMEYSVANPKFLTTYEKEHPLYKYDAMNKQQVIEENFQVQMQTLTQELQATLKRSNSKMKHPLQINTGSEVDETIMYTSNHYPAKIQQQKPRKPSKTMVPNLGLSTPKLVALVPSKPESDRVMDFKDIVDGMDERQKGKLLSALKNSVKTINKKPTNNT